MVAYLKKPEGNEEFHQIVDFLNASHIRYALTENPTIYVSLIKRFWETATARTLDNGEIELTATIDGKVKIVTEASIRRHLQLADSNVFLDKHKRLLQSYTRLYIAPTHTQKLFSNMKRASKGYTGENIPLFPAMIVQGEGSTHPPRSPTQTLVANETVHEERGDSMERDATTTTSLDVKQDSVNTHGSDKGSMTLQELMVFCTTLSKKVESLKTDLMQTKQIYGATYTKLIKKVKKLEKIVKSSQARKRARIVVSDDEDDLEDPSKQGKKIASIDQDPGILLVHHDVEIYGRYGHDMEFDFDFDAAKEVSTAEIDVSTVEPVSTVGAAVTTASVDVSTVSPIRNTRVSTADDITMAETLVYIRKSAAKDKAVVRLEAELDEEKRQRIVRRLQVEEREKYTEAEQARMLAELIIQRKRHFAAYRAEERRNKPPTQAQQRTYMSNYIKHIRVYTLQQLESEVDKAVPELAAGSLKTVEEEKLDQESSKRQKTDESLELAEEPRDKEADELSQEELQKNDDNSSRARDEYRDDLVMLWSLVKEKFNSTEPTDDKERKIWVELKRLFKPDTDDELWKLQKHIHDLTWKLYDSGGVHHVSTEKGIDIYMLVEKEYPLSRETLTQMLVAKLLVDQDNEMSRELLRKIFMQIERRRR
ncbi:hypothetical protein Tco_0870163 [Tanacetum coccineum]